MIRYRLTVGIRTWPWRPSRLAAVQDALDEGFATPDDHVDGRIWWDELAWIEEDYLDQPGAGGAGSLEK